MSSATEALLKAAKAVLTSRDSILGMPSDKSLRDLADAAFKVEAENENRKGPEGPP